MSKTPSVDKVSVFCALVQQGIDAWVEAGKLLVELIDGDPDAVQGISARAPWATREVLSNFERIGRGQVLPQLLVDPSEGAQALLKLPYEEQRRLCDAEVAVASLVRGEIVVASKRIQKLSRQECRTLFSATGIRPIAEQRKLLHRGPSISRAPRDPEPIEENEEGEEEVQQSLEDDETDTAEKHLARAQAELIRAREIMTEKKAPPVLDRHITTALNAIGNLRFELKELPVTLLP